MTTISETLFKSACKLLPGGVNSPVRAFRSVGGTPRFIARAKGCVLTDVDGNEYIDYIGSWGPMILGHAHLEVILAVQRAAMQGTSFGAPCPAEVQLAELIVNRVPSVEKIRFVNSGTEATMSAVRLARATTGRDLIVKFSGCYHGHADCFLIQAGSGVATLGLPDSLGVTAGSANDTRSLSYNNLDEVEEVFVSDGDNIAAVIVEPVAGNMGVVPPEEGFLAGLRKLCDQYGSVLIFDEVMTGFRLAPGGAQQLFSIKPDLTTFGKIIGGGLPVGAYGGRDDLMKLIAPEGPVYQAGTLSGNPLAMAAGVKTMQLLDDYIYQSLEDRSRMLEDGLKSAAEKADIPAVVQRVGSMLTLFFSNKAVKNMDDAKAADHKRFAKFFNAMLDEGIYLPPSGYEAWFISAAHDEGVIERTLETAEKILKSI
ncbi:MAG: glutamate-1-semialdehyde 2,1-aminomutase [Calditrichaeota bacterium]|nr:glutamate-1-semialdehyde 2,1-aminomutase [Calditrichota bacterium]